ncbi:MAG TPA: MATE family efflux transporter [Lacunisphaera sp.]|jgi:putative MATE family efflux protein
MSHTALRTESLLKLTGPIFFQQLTQSVVLLVDLYFFSHLSDEIAGTIGQLVPVIWLGTFVIPVFAGTGVSVASQYMGAKMDRKVIPAYMMNLLFTAGMGLVFGAALWLFSADLGRWMGLPPELNAIAKIYLGAMSFYFLPMGVLVAYNAVLSSRGMTHWLMYSAFLVAILNVILASLFVLGFHWGVRGIVTASVISVTTAMVVSVGLVHGRLGVRFYLRHALRDMLGVLRPMLRLGIPNALEPFSYSVQQIILSKLIIGLGIVAMAANNYAGRVQMFQITFSVGLALGGQILLAHLMGARRFDDVDRLYWKAIRWGTLVAGCYAAMLWFFSDRVLGIFTADPAVKQLGRTLLGIAAFYEPARSVNIIGGFGLKTVGDARFPVVIGMIFIWGILPVVWTVNHYWSLTLVGFWLFFAADEIIRAGINLWRWRTGRWKSMGITGHGEPVPPAAEVLLPEY